MSAYGGVADDLAVARAKRARFPDLPQRNRGRPTEISFWDGVWCERRGPFAAEKNIRGISMIKKSIFAIATAALAVGFTAVFRRSCGRFHAEIDHFRGRQADAEEGR